MVRSLVFLIPILLAATIPATVQMQEHAQTPARPLVHEWLFEVSVELEEPLDIGPTGAGRREIVYIRRGAIDGPRLQAEVLPGGGDWLLRREDGSLLLDIRATARTRDGHLIYVSARGHLWLTPQAMQQMQQGKPVAAAEQYFRVAYTFETGAEAYAWLNRTLAVGVGEFRPGLVKISVYAIR